MELLEAEDHQEAGAEPLGGSHGAAPRGTRKQKDFVRRNTEVCQSSCWAKRRAMDVYRMTCGLFFQWAKYLSLALGGTVEDII